MKTGYWAERLDTLNAIASDNVCQARNEWHEKHEADWLEDDPAAPHPDIYIGSAVVSGMLEQPLISAAPELLEVVQQALPYLENFYRGTGEKDYTDGLMDRMYAIVAAAKGESA